MLKVIAARLRRWGAVAKQRGQHRWVEIDLDVFAEAYGVMFRTRLYAIGSICEIRWYGGDPVHSKTVATLNMGNPDFLRELDRTVALLVWDAVDNWRGYEEDD